MSWTEVVLHCFLCSVMFPLSLFISCYGFLAPIVSLFTALQFSLVYYCLCLQAVLFAFLILSEVPEYFVIFIYLLIKTAVPRSSFFILCCDRNSFSILFYFHNVIFLSETGYSIKNCRPYFIHQDSTNSFFHIRMEQN